jgi:hypothetical protein
MDKMNVNNTDFVLKNMDSVTMLDGENLHIFEKIPLKKYYTKYILLTSTEFKFMIIGDIKQKYEFGFTPRVVSYNLKRVLNNANAKLREKFEITENILGFSMIENSVNVLIITANYTNDKKITLNNIKSILEAIINIIEDNKSYKNYNDKNWNLTLHDFNLISLKYIKIYGIGCSANLVIIKNTKSKYNFVINNGDENAGDQSDIQQIIDLLFVFMPELNNLIIPNINSNDKNHIYGAEAVKSYLIPLDPEDFINNYNQQAKEREQEYSAWNANAIKYYKT